MNEEDLRDCFAMFAMLGLISKRIMSGLETQVVSKEAYEMADAMLEARKAEPEEEGIVAIKKRKYERKSKE